MTQKLIGLLFLVGAGFLAWSVLNENTLSSGKAKTEAQKSLSFSDFVSADLSSLRSQGHLPKEWDDIQHVSYHLHSAFQRELIGKNKISAIPENPSGRYKMEIEFIDVPDDDNPGLILQMSMMDVQSDNKVWELGRTYPLKDFLKKDPLPEVEKSPAKKAENAGEIAGDTKAASPPAPSPTDSSPGK